MIFNLKLWLLLGIIIIAAGIGMIVQLSAYEPQSGCSNHPIDITKMLQYGEDVPSFRCTDKYGKLFDLRNYARKPMLIIFVVDNINHIKTYNDSIRYYLSKYIDKGLLPLYINSNKEQLKYNQTNFLGSSLFFENDSMQFASAFKVNYRGATIILNVDHVVVFSFIGTLSPSRIYKIIEHNQKAIF